MILVERDKDPRIVWIKLNAGKLNVLTLELLRELYDAISDADRSDDVQAIILSSSSENFCAGADLKEISSLSFEDGLRWLEAYMRVVRILRQTGKPTIAAVRGACVAGGNEIAMACDFVVASENARFGQPEVRVGSTAMGLGVQLLPLLLGERRARELLLSGKIIDAREAEKIGLINKVVPDDRLEEEARSLAKDIIDNCSPQAFRVIKSGLNFWTDLALLSFQLARDITAMVWASNEFRERSEEFLSKRKFKSRKFTGIEPR